MFPPPWLIAITAIAFLALGGYGLYERGNAIAANAARAEAVSQLAVAVDANRVQEETIGRLRADAEADAKGQAKLAEELREINEQITAGFKARQELKGADHAVRDFLDLVLPVPLQRGVRP